MDAERIAEVTGLTLRRIRYILEHRVLPGTERASQGHRITRHFTPFEAFGIALAAMMLEAGLRRPLVTQIIKKLSRGQRGSSVKKIPLLEAFSSTGLCKLEIADATNLRLITRGKSREPWRQIGTYAELTHYEPWVVIIIDVGRVRDAIQQVSNT